MNLSDMITAAQARLARQQADLEAQHAERQQENIERFRADLTNLFGNLILLLDVTIAPTLSDSALACFNYENKPYRMSAGRHGWWLTRLDERGKDDDRELPTTEFYASYRNDRETNQDALLLALVDLAARPALPPLPQRSTQAWTPEPTTEERLLAVLREFVRQEAVAHLD